MAYYNDVPDIMNVREIIDTAFGDFEGNAVNFKLLQTVLFLFARQLRLLERRVEVDLAPSAIIPTASTLAITEVKIHAMQKKMKKTKDVKSSGGRASVGGGKSSGGKGRKSGRASEGQSGSDKTSSEKTSSEKTSTDKTSSDKTSTDKTSSDKTSTDKASSDKTSTDKASSDKTSTDKASSDKTSTDKTSSDKTSTDKTSSDKTYSDKTSSDKTSTDKTSTDKTSTDKTSTDKTSSDKTSTDKTSSDKTSTDKTSSDKTSTDKTSSDKTSTDKTSSDKTSTDKTSTDKTSSSKDKSSSKSSSGKSADQQAATDRTKETSGEKRGSTEKGSSKRRPKTEGGKQPNSYHKLLEALEERKEKVLRVIHQRADSFEEGTTSPTPMASVDSIMEPQYEKVLVVQRVPSTEAGVGAMHDQRITPHISVVTQEQFEQVANAVRKLQDQLLPIGTPGFLENAELMQELRRGASLTDAMAALQLSARLEATEKAIAQMISMVTELARQTPGVELDSETEAIFGALGTSGGVDAIQKGKRAPASQGGTKGKRGRSPKGGGASGGGTSGGGAFGGGITTPGIAAEKTFDKIGKTATAQTTGKLKEPTRDTTGTISEKSTESTEMIPAPPPVIPPEVRPEDSYIIKPDYISYDELQLASKELYQNMLNTVTAITARTSNNADQAYKLSMSLDGKVEAALAVASKMTNLENLVSQYAGQINALDTGLSSQMTNYQEQLTQMQHDLESGLETMAEVLGNTGGDTVAVSELNSHFTSLQLDFENMLYRQRDLKDAQDTIAFDLENLWKEIERLRDTKSDREEVADALRDKAGIGQLNGLVSLLQFDAVRGDFEKRIAEAYDKFNNQEIVWQKAIDDLIRDLNEKADLLQVNSLRDEINKYLNIMKGRMQILIDIVGEPKSATLSKKLFRNTACLSCGSPAHMDQEEPTLIPKLPKFHAARQTGEGAEAETEPKGDGDHGICYPNLPIPHPRDPRSHICRRYCGGSHTVINEGPSRVPPSIFIQQPLRPVNTELGTDGKMYLVDDQQEKVPCLPCNAPKPIIVLPTEPHNVAAPAENAESIAAKVSQVSLKSDNITDTVVSVTPPALEVD